MSTMTVNRKSFVTALKAISTFAAVKGVMPILEYVRLHKPAGKQLLLYCTDLERFAFTPVDVETTDEVVVVDLCVNAKDLLAIVSNMVDEDLVLTLDEDKKLVIRGIKNKSKIKMPSLPSFDYPEITTGAEHGTFSIQSSQLFSLIKKTVPFVSSETTKSVLRGVNIYSKEGKLVFQSSDGYTLSVQVSDIDCGFDFNLILAGHSAEQCMRLFGSGEEQVSVTVYENYLEFKKGNQTVHCRLSNGKYANVSAFIPKTFGYLATVSEAALKESIPLISAANNNEKINQLYLAYGDPQSIVFKAKGACAAEVPVAADVKTVEPDSDRDFGERKYNLAYFQRAVNAVGQENVVFHLSPATELRKQLVISGGNPKASLFTVCPFVDPVS